MNEFSIDKKQPFSAPLAWKGESYPQVKDWALWLDASDLEELRVAVRQVGDICFSDISSENFVLPTLGAKLKAELSNLRQGTGFLLIKGIDVDEYEESDLRRIFLGISSYLGISVSQSYRGDYLGDVMNYEEEGNERPYRRGGLLEMHRDPCDIVGLLCYRQAKQGGYSRVASCATVWNLFLQERPDLLEPLLKGFRLYITRDDRTGDSPVTEKRIPVFGQDPDGLIHCTYIAELAQSGVELGGESWEPLAQEALEYFEEITNRPGVYLDMNIERGDIQFLNNRTTVHGRTDYEDWPEFERRRLMFRVWLMCQDWPQAAAPVNQLLFGKIDRANGGVGRRL